MTVVNVVNIARQTERYEDHDVAVAESLQIFRQSAGNTMPV